MEKNWADRFDLKDKKIMYLLLENARMPASEIAKYVRMSKNAVPYRILRLVEKEIIWKFCPIINYAKLGVSLCDVFVKLTASTEREAEIKNYFRQNQNIISVDKLLGKWDLFLQFVAKDIKEFEEIWSSATEVLGDSLDYYEVKFASRPVKTDYQLFHDVSLPYARRPQRRFGSQIVKLSALDKKILNHMNEVGAISKYSAIAKSTNASLETVRNRVNRMIDEGVLLNFVPFVSPKKVGKVQFLVLMQFRHLTKGIEKSIITYMKNCEKIRLAFRSIESPEMYFWAAENGHFKMQELLAEFKTKFPNWISNADLMAITEDVTLNLFPKGMMEV